MKELCYVKPSYEICLADIQTFRTLLFDQHNSCCFDYTLRGIMKSSENHKGIHLKWKECKYSINRIVCKCNFFSLGYFIFMPWLTDQCILVPYLEQKAASMDWTRIYMDASLIWCIFYTSKRIHISITSWQLGLLTILIHDPWGKVVNICLINSMTLTYHCSSCELKTQL